MRRSVLALPALLLAAACPSGAPGLLPTGDGPTAGIGLVCLEGVPAEFVAAQAVASAYGYRGILDLQLLPLEQAPLVVAVYRADLPDARPGDVFAAVLAVEGPCAALVSRGDACSPPAASPIFLPPLPPEAASLGPAEVGPWEPLGETVVRVPLALRWSDDAARFPTVEASGWCAFQLVPTPQGLPVPHAPLAWIERARTVETVTPGEDYDTRVEAVLEFEPGPAPRPARLAASVVDVGCRPVADRNAACRDRCAVLAEGLPPPPDSDPCAAACEAFPAEPGRWCTAQEDRVVERHAVRRETDGRLRYTLAGQTVDSRPLDAPCLLAGGTPDDCLAAPPATP